MSLDARRPKAITIDTVARMPDQSGSAMTVESPVEPLFDDFHARLKVSPSRPLATRDNSLPGLDHSIPSAPYFAQNSMAAPPPDFMKPRTLKSVQNQCVICSSA